MQVELPQAFVGATVRIDSGFVAGEGPVAGFVLKLKAIWEGV
jgi:hypothetical protein